MVINYNLCMDYKGTAFLRYVQVGLCFLGDIFYANGCIIHQEVNSPVGIVEVIDALGVVLLGGARVLAEYLVDSLPWAALLKRRGEHGVIDMHLEMVVLCGLCEAALGIGMAVGEG